VGGAGEQDPEAGDDREDDEGELEEGEPDRVAGEQPPDEPEPAAQVPVEPPRTLSEGSACRAIQKPALHLSFRLI